MSTEGLRYRVLAAGENRHRWLEMRRFGRLSQIIVDIPADKVFSSMPINVFEANARQ